MKSKAVKIADNVKFLGVFLNDRLSFMNYVNCLQKLVFMAMGMLDSVSNLVHAEVKLMANALIYLNAQLFVVFECSIMHMFNY